MEEQYQHILKAHRTIIYKICYGFCEQETEVKDLFQDACVNIWLGLNDFQGRSNIATWIYRVTLNTCLLQARKKSKNKIRYTNQFPEQHDPVNTEKWTLEADIELLYTCIRQLNDKDKSVIMLYLEGLSYKEMETVLGIKQNALAVRVNRIKKNIRKQFINHGRIKNNLG
ncbi:MAG: sigma-70 family RNA polymerase sigma factor [Bacteroidota bacterium]